MQNENMPTEKKLAKLWQKIMESLDKVGRRKEDLHLIAVSKTRSAEEIRMLYELGQRDFGENKPQELRDKQPYLPADLRWHMIGHLQSNKLKYVVGKCALIHSVESIKLADEIQAFAQKQALTADILLQVNIAGEASKQGFSEADLSEAVKRIAEFPNIALRGLMTVAPYVEDPERNRGIFQKIRQISVDIRAKNYDNVTMDILSMGMSGDYQVAIEEGATHIRLGTAIFGERNYK